MYPHVTRQGEFNDTVCELADATAGRIVAEGLQGDGILEAYDALLASIQEAYKAHRRALPKTATARSAIAAEELRKLLTSCPDPSGWEERATDFDAALGRVRDCIEEEARAVARDYQVRVEERSRDDTELSKRAPRSGAAPHFVSMRHVLVNGPAQSHNPRTYRRLA